ncbi:MAG: hypothetical protein DRI56_00270 [Chloroflexota bacterium]|nr:MAG: hypothetical protein DRI56_00270 [Chloroflexota bacterium]
MSYSILEKIAFRQTGYNVPKRPNYTGKYPVVGMAWILAISWYNKIASAVCFKISYTSSLSKKTI